MPGLMSIDLLTPSQLARVIKRLAQVIPRQLHHLPLIGAIRALPDPAALSSLDDENRKALRQAVTCELMGWGWSVSWVRREADDLPGLVCAQAD